MEEAIKSCSAEMIPIDVLRAEYNRIFGSEKCTCSEAFLASTIKRVLEWIDSPAYRTRLAECGYETKEAGKEQR